jgi:carbon storage regulator
MLVLTRKIDQGIVISGNIYIRVLGVERDRVKIGISAPLEVTILRQELLDREEEAGRNEGSTPSKVSTNEEHP